MLSKNRTSMRSWRSVVPWFAIRVALAAVTVLSVMVGVPIEPAAASMQDSPHWAFCKKNPNVERIIIVMPGKVANGTNKAECFIGTNGDDKINAGGGADVVAALGGDDYVSGGSGNDVILGGAGDDELHGGPGDDELLGQAGHDLLIGNSGRDYLDAGQSSMDAAFGENDKYSSNLSDTCISKKSWCRISKVEVKFAANAEFHTLGSPTSTGSNVYYFTSSSKPRAHKEHRASKCAKWKTASTGNDNGTTQCTSWRYAWKWQKMTYSDGTETGKCVKSSATVCPSESTIAAGQHGNDHALMKAGTLFQSSKMGTCKKNCSTVYTATYGSGAASRTGSSYPKGVAAGTQVDVVVPEEVVDELLELDDVLKGSKKPGKDPNGNGNGNGNGNNGGSVISGEATATNQINLCNNCSAFENGLLGPLTDAAIADAFNDLVDTVAANAAGLDDLLASMFEAVADFFSGDRGCWGSCLDPNPNPPNPNPSPGSGEPTGDMGPNSHGADGHDYNGDGNPT